MPPRGNTDLASREYDDWLSKNKKERQVRERHNARKTGKDEGWQFGLGKHPVYRKNKAECRQELEKCGLAIEGDCKGITWHGGKYRRYK